MPTVLEHAPKVRFPRLTTHFGSIPPLFCAGLAFRRGQNFAVSGLGALSGHSERRVALPASTTGRFYADFSSKAALLGQKIALR